MDYINIQIENTSEYRLDLYLSGVKCSTLLTKDLQLMLKECENKTRMLAGLAKGKVLTSVTSNH